MTAEPAEPTPVTVEATPAEEAPAEEAEPADEAPAEETATGDEEENNNSIAMANPITVGRAGAQRPAIMPLGDVDYFKFAAKANVTYTVEVLNVDEALETELRILTADGTQLSRSYGNGTGNVYNRLQVTPSVSQMLFLEVKDDRWNDGTGAYTVRVLPDYKNGHTWDNSGEPNDTRSLAQAIGVGRTAAKQATILTRGPYQVEDGDVDYYRFSAKANVTYTVEVLNVDQTMTTNVAILAENGTLLSKNDYGNGTGNVFNRVQVTPSVAQTLFVRVEANGSTQSGAYTVRVLPDYNNGHTWDNGGEPNDTISLAQAIGVGPNAAKTATILNRGPYQLKGGDVDYYRFSAKANVTYTVEVLNVGQALDTELYVRDASGTQLASDVYGGGTGDVFSRVQVRPSVAQTLFVHVEGYAHTSSGAYTVRVLPDYRNGLTRDANAEPNDTFALSQAITVNRAESWAIQPQGPYNVKASDRDTYRFTGEAGRSYTITATGAMGLQMVVFDGSEVRQASDSCYRSDRCTVTTTITPSVSQTYYVQVNPTQRQHGAYGVCVAQGGNGCITFKDVPPGTQFYNEIHWMAWKKISTGYPDGTYKPVSPVKRDAMAAFLYRMAGSPRFTPTKQTFRDVPRSNQFYKEIEWLASTGISTGWDVGGGRKEYRPLEDINRDAMAAFLYRLNGKPRFTPTKVSFRDVSRTTQFYMEIEWMASTGISTGWDVGGGRKEYRPVTSVNRDAMAAFLYRFDGKFGTPKP
ncbi:MAG: pre-peptidase C-terminal domain-containing protein [Propionibacteriaceae bacterium]|nr:pre-peptidase C-terminal domain-containing protein [Propionibacteriaceae bacterium]